MKSRDKLLDELVADLTPVKKAPNPRRSAGAWLLFSALFVILLTHLLGPLRPTAMAQLGGNPRFLAEMLIGALFTGALGFVAFYLAQPGGLRMPLRVTVTILGALWLGSFCVGLVAPALEPSMMGKRDHCALEIFLYAWPPLLVAFFWQQRCYPLRPELAAVVAGLAAGMLPALYMQIACMYAPVHTLVLHIGPGLAAALLAPLLVVIATKVKLRSG